MNTKDFLRLGVPLGEATRRAKDFVAQFILGGSDKSRFHEEVATIVANPAAFVVNDLRKDFARALLHAQPMVAGSLVPTTRRKQQHRQHWAGI